MHPILSSGIASPQSIFEESNQAFHPVGVRAVLDDGRAFRYAHQRTGSVGGSVVVRARAAIANHLNQTQTTSGGSVFEHMKEISVDIGGTGVNLGDYEEGMLVVRDGTGQGRMHRIRTHNGSSAGSEALEVVLHEPLRADWSATTDVSLIPNPYLDLQTSATQARRCVGGTLITTTAGANDESDTVRSTLAYHYWLQTAGPISLLVGAGDPIGADFHQPDVGGIAVASIVTAGAVDQAVLPTILNQDAVGTWMETGVSTEYNLIDLKIAF